MERKPKCFNCGEYAPRTIARTKPPQFKRHICLAEKCWEAWRKLSEGGES